MVLIHEPQVVIHAAVLNETVAVSPVVFDHIGRGAGGYGHLFWEWISNRSWECSLYLCKMKSRINRPIIVYGRRQLNRMEWRLCHEVHELIDEGTLRWNEVGGNMTFGGGLFEQEGDF